MKANRKFVKGEEAVSAVIGVILMVAITVAIAATVYVYVSGMIGGTKQSTPTIACNIDSSANKIIIATAEPTVQWNDVVITNSSGPSCRYAVYTGGGVINSSMNPTGMIIAGDYIYCWAPTGSVVFTMRYVPTNSLLGSWTVII
ncbi:MAG: type IV pilin N-terminal domain-containing protein [Candidatus Thermoplasmatota archaeon]|nr:type IV pilin N-terminal domain-containing protein [Candidatus Thermoplasmatota archaeon]